MPRIAALALAIASCTARLQPERPLPPDLVLGRRVYRASCAPCHGARGGGDGPAAQYLDVRPRVLTDAAFKFRTTGTGEAPTDADLLRTVTDGIYGTPMRGFRETLGPHERRSAVAFIRTLAPVHEGPTTLVRVPAARPAPNPARGRQVWVLMKCAECHGERGRGDGPANATLVNDRNEPNPSHDFSRGFLKRGVSRETIYLTLRTGLNGTPMPSYTDALNDADLWALADFALTLIPRRGLWDWLSEPSDRDYLP